MPDGRRRRERGPGLSPRRAPSSRSARAASPSRRPCASRVPSVSSGSSGTGPAPAGRSSSASTTAAGGGPGRGWRPRTTTVPTRSGRGRPRVAGRGTAPRRTSSGAAQVQVRVLDDAATPPTGLRAVVVDPGTSDADATAGAGVAGAATAAAGRPTILTRKAWGADESMRRDDPAYGQAQIAFVHHTAETNSYSSAQVPAIIRGIYDYHVNGQEWNDIGYNFLVDRFGRTWEGRYGGVDRTGHGRADRQPQLVVVRRLGHGQLHLGRTAVRGRRCRAAGDRVEVQHPRHAGQGDGPGGGPDLQPDLGPPRRCRHLVPRSAALRPPPRHPQRRGRPGRHPAPGLRRPRPRRQRRRRPARVRAGGAHHATGTARHDLRTGSGAAARRVAGRSARG